MFEVYNKLFEPIQNLEVISIKTAYDYYTWDQDNYEYIDNNYYKLLKDSVMNVIDTPRKGGHYSSQWTAYKNKK